VPVGGRQAAGRVTEMREWVGFSLQEEVAGSSPRPVLGSVVFCGLFYENHQFFEVSETTQKWGFFDSEFFQRTSTGSTLIQFWDVAEVDINVETPTLLPPPSPPQNKNK
jgi:hypothetical protein